MTNDDENQDQSPSQGSSSYPWSSSASTPVATEEVKADYETRVPTGEDSGEVSAASVSEARRDEEDAKLYDIVSQDGLPNGATVVKFKLKRNDQEYERSWDETQHPSQEEILESIGHTARHMNMLIDQGRNFEN
jgi:hypothetical protein